MRSSRALLIFGVVSLLPNLALAQQTKLAVNPMSFTIGAGEEKYITAKEIGHSGGQPALFGGSCLEPNAYVRVKTRYEGTSKSVLEAEVTRTRRAPMGNGKCNITFALRGQHGWTDHTIVRVTLTK